MVLLLIGAFGLPLAKVLATSVEGPGPTLGAYVALGSNAVFVAALLRTLRMAATVTVGSLVLGYPLALALARLRGWKGRVVAACVLVPLWTSVLIRSYAWIIILQRTGPLNGMLQWLGVTSGPVRLIYTEGAVILAMTHVMLPFMALPIAAALGKVPHELVRAAAGLGAGRLRILAEVLVPLSLPGVLAGASLVFVLSLGFYVTPALVGGPGTLMVAGLIGQQMTELLDWRGAGAMAMVLLVATMLLIALLRRWLGTSGAVRHV